VTPVLNKRQNYNLWQSGAFGNKLRAWRSVEEWRASGFQGSISLRCLRANPNGSRGLCVYDVDSAEVEFWINELIQKTFVRRGDIMVNESAPDEAVVLQGEYLNELQGGLYYSRAQRKMRDALLLAPEGALGLRADMLLRGAMTPSSYEDWRVLLDQYPGHVLEVSIYDRCLGDIPGRNALVWEVRRY
jgi:hypothetical protein